MSDPQALHVTRNVIPGKLGVDLHLHRVHIPLVCKSFDLNHSEHHQEHIVVRDKDRRPRAWCALLLCVYVACSGRLHCPARDLPGVIQQFCPPRLKTVTTPSCEIQKSYCCSLQRVQRVQQRQKCHWFNMFSAVMKNATSSQSNCLKWPPCARTNASLHP